MKSLEKFKLVKSLFIPLPSACIEPIDDILLMKWKLVFGNNKAAPYVFILFVNSISDSKGKIISLGDEPLDFTKQFVCNFVVSDAVMRQRMLSYFISDFPLLEKVSVTDLGKRGSISVSSGRIIHQLRNNLDNNTMEVQSKCRINVLKLPVSGCVMKGVSLVLLHRKNDAFENMDFDDEFENGVDAVYTEDMKEIAMNNRLKLVMRILSDGS